jgi:hypothetical protein
VNDELEFPGGTEENHENLSGYLTSGPGFENHCFRTTDKHSLTA